MVLVSTKAPDFIAPAVIENGEIINKFHLNKFILNKYAVLFFWPMDFTYVCPSEIIAFNKRYDDFKKRNVEIIGVSCDSQFVHQAWQNTGVEKGGIGKIHYPMVADTKKEIQKKYGVEHAKLGVALRASFLIDKKNIIRHQSINDLPLGRNIDEIIRIVDALQFHEKYGEVCPAQWNKGKKGINPSAKGISSFLTDNIQDL